MQDNWHLSHPDFFHELAQEKEQFISLSTRLDLERHSMVFFQGDDGDSCFYVASGLVRIFNLTASGKEPLFFLRRPGELFGLSEVIDRLSRKANAQTILSTTLYRMDSGNFDLFLQQNHRVVLRVISVLGARIRYLGDRVSQLMTLSVMERLVKALVCIAYDEITSYGPDGPVEIPVHLSQEQLASMTGSTQPTVSELLQQLQKERLITVSRKKITLLEPLALLRRVGAI